MKKRINLVSVKLIKEGSILYGKRRVLSPKEAFDLGKKFLVDSDREKMILLCLDSKNQPTAINTVSIGCLNSSIVHPREVFKVAILSNSASIIVYHNHPSGDVKPSKDDINITQRLKESGKILGIDLIDHIIVGSSEMYYSFKEKGNI
ncbi:JAB domain-containing protein [Clostridium perfringens]|uniref:JAB domain-containing protein n=1 Tax=Clostridium perfringens TaxID=1502 RepID=UPI0039E825F4